MNQTRLEGMLAGHHAGCRCPDCTAEILRLGELDLAMYEATMSNRTNEPEPAADLQPKQLRTVEPQAPVVLTDEEIRIIARQIAIERGASA